MLASCTRRLSGAPTVLPRDSCLFTLSWHFDCSCIQIYSSRSVTKRYMLIIEYVAIDSLRYVTLLYVSQVLFCIIGV